MVLRVEGRRLGLHRADDLQRRKVARGRGGRAKDVKDRRHDDDVQRTDKITGALGSGAGREGYAGELTCGGRGEVVWCLCGRGLSIRLLVGEGRKKENGKKRKKDNERRENEDKKDERGARRQ